MKNKQGQSMGLGGLISVVLIFAVVGLLAIYGLDIMESSRQDFCDYNYDVDEAICYACPADFPTYNDTGNNCYNGTFDTGDYTVYETATLNSSSSSIEGVAKIPDKMPTLGNVVIAAIIIGVLLAAFGGFIAARRM